MIFYVSLFRKTLTDNATIYKARMVDYVDRNDLIWQTAIISFLIGVVADFLYCRAYGGYLGYLKYSAYVRSGVTDMIANKWSFLIVFRKCIVISSYVFFAQIKKNGVFRISRALLFVVSFVMSLMVLFANKGRISLVVYLVVFPLSRWLYKKKLEYIRFKHLATIGVLGGVVLACFMYISEKMGRASEFSMAETLITEVSFCFSNFKVLTDNINIEDVRLFVDIIAYPLFLLPSSLWSRIVSNTASDMMTIYVWGSRKGVGDVYGEVPIDAISLGYFQFGIIGVCISAILAGIVSAILYKLVDKISDDNTRIIIITYISIDIILRSLMYADSYNIVQRIFPLIVFGVIYMGVSLIYKKNKSNSRIFHYYKR